MSRPAIHDAHCHLADLEAPDEAVAKARACGVTPILAVSMNAVDAEGVLALRDRHPGVVLAGVGLHPSRVPALGGQALERELSRLERLAPRADFIGEIGLDYKDAREPRQQARQRDVLDRFLDLAARLRMPVNLHTRRADSELLDRAAAFAAASGRKALLHWFTHSRRMARRCAEAGLFISAGPSILIDPRQAEVARSIDPRLLLVETDAPVVYAGGTARPSWAARVARELALLRGESFEGMAARLAENLDRFLTRDSQALGR